MPNMRKITVISSEKVWNSPDGQVKIFVLECDGGKVYKTYSEKIASGEGQSFDVEVTSKPGKSGNETWVGFPKRDGFGGGKAEGGGGGGGYSREPMELRIASMSMAYAKDRSTALKTSDKEMFALADSIMAWMQAKLKGEQAPAPNTKKRPEPTPEEDDSLPFEGEDNN